jgi:hypothetical protein
LPPATPNFNGDISTGVTAGTFLMAFDSRAGERYQRHLRITMLHVV